MVAMRIAYMLTSLGIGGAEKQVVALAERMAVRGHLVLLVVLRERQTEQWQTTLDVVHLKMRKAPGSVAAGLLRARRILRGFGQDILHSHTYPANMAARMLRLSGAAPVVISTIHNVYEGGWPRMLAYRLTDSLSLRTTAVSEAAERRYVGMRAVSKLKCSVITNGIDLEEFAPDRERRAQMRAALGAGDDFVWLSAGRNVPAKDFPNLMHAFAKVWPAFPKTQLWIAGERASSGSERKHYSLLATPRGTLDRVRFLGLRRDMPAVFDAADGFVLSSAWEGMPLVVGEAMAMERPVVATDVGGVRELAGEDYELVPPQNAERLAEGMLSVMRLSAEARATMGRSARKRIQARFNIEDRAREWESFYRSLAGASA
ncbi:MAG TPA: glycosyltransferase [Terracidiphilus sp.]|nr:glycosyltransferase [Terracidiphilus sp.]